MKFINSSDKIDTIDNKETLTINLNKLGRSIIDPSEKIFATMITQNHINPAQTKYGILVLNNQAYDPYGIDSHRESNLNLQLKQVDQRTYNYYVSYLQTKNKLYLTRAQRSYING